MSDSKVQMNNDLNRGVSHEIRRINKQIEIEFSKIKNFTKVDIPEYGIFVNDPFIIQQKHTLLQIIKEKEAYVRYLKSLLKIC